MPRFPTPWSKKRGKRTSGNALTGVVGEVAFYALLFLIGVFGLSLVLIIRFAPQSVSRAFHTDALPTDLSIGCLAMLAVAAIATGGAD